jgi:hypothetical protein
MSELVIGIGLGFAIGVSFCIFLSSKLPSRYKGKSK